MDKNGLNWTQSGPKLKIRKVCVGVCGCARVCAGVCWCVCLSCTLNQMLGDNNFRCFSGVQKSYYIEYFIENGAHIVTQEGTHR